MENMLSQPVFKKQRPTIRRADTKQVINFHGEQDAMQNTNSSIPNATVQFQGRDLQQTQEAANMTPA